MTMRTAGLLGLVWVGSISWIAAQGPAAEAPKYQVPPAGIVATFDAPPLPCTTPSRVICVWVISFMSGGSFARSAPPGMGGLTLTTNAIGPIRQRTSQVADRVRALTWICHTAPIRGS